MNESTECLETENKIFMLPFMITQLCLLIPLAYNLFEHSEHFTIKCLHALTLVIGVVQSVSELMNALKGLKVDGVPTEGKKKIGFSAAAEFKKRKLQKIQTPKKAATESESVSKRYDYVDQ